MSEIGLKVDLDLDVKEAREKLDNLKKEVNKEPLKIKLDLGNKDLGSLGKDLALVTKNLKTLHSLSGDLKNIKLDNLGDKLNKAFKIDDKVIKDLKQIESALKDVNTLSKVNNNSSNKQVSELNKLIKEYEKYEKQLVNVKKKQEDLNNRGKTNEANALNEQIALINKLQNEIKKEVKVGFKGEFNKATQEIKESYAEISKVNSAINDGKQWDRMAADIKKATNEVEEFRNKYSSLNGVDEIADRLARSLKEVGEGSNTKQAANDIERLTKELREAENAAERTSNEMKNVSNSFSFFGNFGDDFKSNLFTFTAGELLADGIREITRELGTLVMEWDRAFANLKKVANYEDVMNIDQLDAIGQKAVDIAKNVGMASSDVIQAIADTIQMGGYGMEEATKIAEQTMMLANVAEMTQQAASEGIVTMMSAFNLDPMKEVPIVVNGVTKSVDELTNGMDILNHVGNNFAISTDGILSAIQSGANVLAEYGVSMTDTVAMIASANTTIQNPEKVGNALKTIGINLAGIKTSAKDGEISLNKTAKALDSIAGIDIFKDDNKTEIKDMAQLIEELGNKWEGFNDVQKAGLSEAIAGK